jgi:RHS repeat-associated protein
MLWSTEDAGALHQRTDYVYDVFGDLLSDTVTVSGVATTTYHAYRITVAAPGIFDNVNQNWADLDGSKNLGREYVAGQAFATPLARINSGAAAWLLQDRQGSTILITDNTGSVIRTLTYDGFGNVLSSTGSGDQGVVLFDGYRWDAVTGLYVTHWRWYNPVTGKWTSVDPIGFAGGDWNTSRYVFNYPGELIDSSGLELPPNGGDSYHNSSRSQGSVLGGSTQNKIPDRSSGSVLSGLTQKMLSGSNTRNANQYEFGGPDVTDWFLKEIQIARKYVGTRMQQLINVNPAVEGVGLDGFYKGRLDILIDFGNRLTDYKSRFDKDPNINTDAQRWPYKAFFDVKSAGNYDPDTVTLMGKVVTLTESRMENAIMFS